MCTADGVPLPTSIVWLKNNRLLQTEQNDRFKVVEEEVPPFQPYILSARRSTLVVTDLRTSDGGTYSCSASNGIGTAVLPQAYGLTVTEPGIDLFMYMNRASLMTAVCSVWFSDSQSRNTCTAVSPLQNP